MSTMINTPDLSIRHYTRCGGSKSPRKIEKSASSVPFPEVTEANFYWKAKIPSSKNGVMKSLPPRSWGTSGLWSRNLIALGKYRSNSSRTWSSSPLRRCQFGLSRVPLGLGILLIGVENGLWTSYATTIFLEHIWLINCHNSCRDFKTSSRWYFDHGPGLFIRGFTEPFKIFIACFRVKSHTRQNSSKIAPSFFWTISVAETDLIKICSLKFD